MYLRFARDYAGKTVLLRRRYLQDCFDIVVVMTSPLVEKVRSAEYGGSRISEGLVAA
jgi:hypothetical protein